MAFVRKNLTKIGGGNGGNAMYHYTTTDPVGTYGVANYFNDAVDLLEVNDVIIVIQTDDATATASKLFYVKSNDGTNVDVSTGVALSGA